MPFLTFYTSDFLQPYLDCVVNEMLRLRGPITAAAPRVSPGKMIGDVYVPAGTVVSNAQYTTHRDPEVFPSPFEFNPDRWRDPTTEMKIMFRPFLSGPRNCIGMHLARSQILLTVCAIYQRYDVDLDARMTAEMMEMRDQGFMTPIAKQLWVKLTPCRT
jgi:cytochrome P450